MKYPRLGTAKLVKIKIISLPEVMFSQVVCVELIWQPLDVGQAIERLPFAEIGPKKFNRLK